MVSVPLNPVPAFLQLYKNEECAERQGRKTAENKSSKRAA